MNDATRCKQMQQKIQDKENMLIVLFDPFLFTSKWRLLVLPGNRLFYCANDFSLYSLMTMQYNHKLSANFDGCYQQFDKIKELFFVSHCLLKEDFNYAKYLRYNISSSKDLSPNQFQIVFATQNDLIYRLLKYKCLHL